MMRNKEKTHGFHLLCIILLLAIAVRILWLNDTWPQSEINIVSRGEKLDVDGVVCEVVDSVLGTVEETITYYGMPSEGISEQDVLSLMNDGWHGYVMAVKFRVTNTTSEDVMLGSYLFPYAASVQWYNGYEMFADSLYNDVIDNHIPSGESRDYVFPYIVYQEQFPANEWKELPTRPFYLVREPYYPVKTMLECTPTFLQSTYKVFRS